MTSATMIPVGADRAERELVLLCARLELEGPARERFQTLLAEPLDWEEVLNWAGYHHVTPLLHRHVAELGTDTIPAGILTTLRDRHLATIAHQMKLMAELRSLAQAMESAGAPPVVWKGPVLALTLYPNPDLRTFSDLDLMVRRKDVVVAQRVLRDRGYVLKEGMAATEEEVFQGGDRDAPMWNRELGVAVDLHWGAVGRYLSSAMDCERLWKESVPIPVLGGTVRGLEPGSMLLALALHGAKHTPFPWPALKWVTDVEAYLRGYPAEKWTELLADARARGCLRMLLLGCRLAQDLVEAPIPPEVAVELERDRVVGGLASSTAARMLSAEPVGFTLAERIQFDLAVRERRRDRIRYHLTRLGTPSPRDVQALPRGFGFLRIPLRLLRLSGKYLAHPSRIRSLFSTRHSSGPGSES